MIGDIKHIVVIQSLSVNESKTGEALYNDIITRQVVRCNSTISHELFIIDSKEKLFEILK